MIKNEHLIPEIIFNVVEKFKTSTNQNEKLNLQFRLEAIRDYVSESLESKPVRDVFRGMKRKQGQNSWPSQVQERPNSPSKMSRIGTGNKF